MSLRWNPALVRGLLAVACALVLLLTAVTPALAAGNKSKQKRMYTVNNGPCRVEKLPKGASHQWTPAGESIVHKVRRGQGLQGIAVSYGFEGDNAYRKLFDANPQLERPWLDQPGIVIRVPVCGTEQRKRKLPKPPPPPEPTPEPESSGDAPASTPAPAPASKPASKPAVAVPSGSVWDQLAQCESGGNWSINTGNGYYGGLQFSLSSWRAVGGSGYPHENSREEQILRGQKLQAAQGWGAWPSCAAKLGLL